MFVFVLNKRDKPLMPCSPTKARHLLKQGKAKVVRRTPFTIRLTIATGETVQPISLGVDAGSKHIGLSATTVKAELFASEIELRDDITKLLVERRINRLNRRFTKTRYREARHKNRVHTKQKGWFPPSIRHKIESHIKSVNKLRTILPLAEIIIETAAFDLQKIKNPEIEGEQYQQGEQLGFWNVREYVLFRDGHECCHCHGKSKDPILNVHHIESRKTGGNAPNNLITLCKTCHQAYHAGKILLDVERGRNVRHETHMGIMRWELFKRAKEANADIPVKATFGYITKCKRVQMGMVKTKCADAFCIAGNLNARPSGEVLYQKQTRRHNRKIHKVTFIKGGIRKRNQALYEMFNFRLFDKVLCKGRVGFVWARRSSGKFQVRTLTGEHISDSIIYKKLKLIEHRKRYLMEYRKESCLMNTNKERSSSLCV